MSNPKLFQYALIWHPTADQKKEGQKSKLIIEPKFVLAADAQAAGTIAAMNIPTEHKDTVEQLEVAVRPF